MYVTIFLFALLLYLYSELNKNNHFSVLLRRYQCPSIVPFGGNLYQFISEQGILPSVEAWMSLSGQNVLVSLAKKPYIIVHELKMVKFIMESQKLMAKSEDYNVLKNIFGTGLIASQGNLWRTHRILLTPAFRRHDDFVSTFKRHANTLVIKLRDKLGVDSFDIFDCISLCSLDIISEATLGFSIDAQIEITEFVSVFQQLPDTVFAECFFPYRFKWLYYISAQYSKNKKNTFIIEEFLKKEIGKRRRETSRKVPKGPHGRFCFLNHLLRVDKEGRKLTDDEVYHEMITIMFIGYGTISSALSFTLYLLSTNKDIQDKVFEKMNAQCETDPNSDKCNYLEQVIKESLRLYPSISVFTRKLEQDGKFDKNDIILPKGVSTIFIPYVLHRDPILYPNPKQFDPDRFSAENERRRKPYTYMSFSAGPRNCIATKFAMLELKTVLAQILSAYEILPAQPHHEIQPIIRLTLESANGIRIQLKERRSNGD